MILDPILISFRVSAVALVAIAALSLFLVRQFTEREFPLQHTLETLILLPMVLPPTILGYGLLMILGRSGPVGRVWVTLFGYSPVFTWGAAVVAATIVGLPLMYQSVKTAMLDIPGDYVDAARTLGLTERRIFWRIKVPLARHGILAGLALAFARAFGEFGATLMVAGNIPGRTQTLPIALYYAVESGEYARANLLLALMLLASLGLIVLVMHKGREGSRCSR